MLVVDSSLLIGALAPDEPERDLDSLFEPYEELLAPWLLWVELRNTFLTLERRGRLTPDFTDRALSTVEGYCIVLDQMPRSESVLRLARRHQLTAYDALYLELALQRSADLATLDSRLAAAAAAEGVRLAV